MKKKHVFLLIGGLALIGFAIWAGFRIKNDHFPIKVDPSPEWEPYISSLDIQREQFFVERDGVKLEAELFIPNGGSDQRAAVVFTPGSGDSLYQNYAGGLVENYILDVFLHRDMAVLLINKRGMGKSEGNWTKNDFPGRAGDVYTGVQTLQDHPAIDADRIGVVGHSQGGWIAVLTAALHDDVAFFISLVGPTTSVEGNMVDNYRGHYRCEGYEGDELEKKVERQLKSSRRGASIGKVIPFGMLGFDAGIIDYDPDEILRTVDSPGLLVFAERDALVDAVRNTQTFYNIFDGRPPDHLNIITIKESNHIFRIVEHACVSYEDSQKRQLSDELTVKLDEWLSRLGY